MRSIARSARRFVLRRPTWQVAPSSRVARFALAATLLALALLGRAGDVRAASTGQTSLYFFQGQQAATSNGDFISANTNLGGLGSVYQYYVEVPTGLGTLVVELFDADVGRGGATEAAAGRDRLRTGANTTVIYTLVNPSGGTNTTLNCDNTTCTDNGWQTMATVTNPAAGHWILRVNMGNGDDLNALGIRANDGDATGGGTELNVYYDSYTEYGVNPPASGTSAVTFTEYPFITSGCSFGENDYDFDSDQGTVGQLSFTSRAGLLSTTIPSTSLSANDAWTRNTISGYQSDSTASDYGIWTLQSTIDSYVNAAGQNGNYAPIYLSSFNGAANPPTAEPQTGAFRVYLATDAGGAPVKPYVEQFARFFSGARTPAVGSTTRIAITVRVTNPTGRAITFSTTNTVRAQVPGAGVVYAGSATSGATQGTITAQPATGGTGFVTWNPGTLAAGAAAYMTYQVNVTPTSAGQRLPVTATPASGNGTRAIYVDETGAALTRSTITFGPLCELAVTAGTTTAAEIARFESYKENGQSVIEWTTASEASTIGFEIYRRNRLTGEFTKRNDGLLLGLLDAPAGGTYRFVDPFGDARRGIDEYYIVEQEANGSRRMYGPLGNDSAPASPQRTSTTLRDIPHEAYSRVPLERASKRMILSRDRLVHLSPRTNDDAAFIDVRDDGFYDVDTSEIARALGMPEKEAVARARTRGFALTVQGAPVAWTADAAGDHLRFYGEAIDSPYTRDNAYRIAPGTGIAMQPAVVHAPNGERAPSFMSRVHAEQDKVPALALSPDPESDYWYWDYIQSGDAAFGMRTFKVDVPAPVAGASASLTVSLQGASSTGVVGEHHVAVALNGTNVGESQWTGVTPLAATFTFDPKLLVPGENEIELLGLLDGTTPYSVFFVDSFDIAYPRAYTAQGSLAFTAAQGASVDVSDFTSPRIAIYDVANPLRPRVVNGAAITSANGGYRASFRAAAPGARYVALTPESALRPERVRSGGGSPLRSSHHAADYVMIASSELMDAARPLAERRTSQGYHAEIVDLQDVIDAFGNGVTSPWAIRDFLAYAHSTWATPPRFVVLVGDGSYDYKDILGTNEPNLVPPVLVRGVNGIYSSDPTLADITGNDGAPDIAIGRIPVTSSEDLSAYIAKIIAHEGASPNAGTLLLAGPADGAADFGATSDALADTVTALTPIDRVYLDATTLDEARARLRADLAQSPSFVSYFGHGAMNELAASGLLRADDVSSLPTASRLPVFTTMTCAVGRFELPGLTSLGEALVRQPNAGAIAVLSPSGLSLHADATALAERFFRESLASSSPVTLGEAVQRALAKSAAGGAEPEVLAVYNLLGDPAVRLASARSSAAPPPSGTGGGTVE